MNINFLGFNEDKLLTLKWFGLMWVAIIGFVLLAPIMFVSQVTFRLFHRDYDLWYYFQAIAVGIDSLGGSIIYGSKLHTISGMSGYFNHLIYAKDRLFKFFRWWHQKIQVPFIDRFFGKGHCDEEAKEEGLVKDIIEKEKVI